MAEHASSQPFRVVIAGGGVAGLEAMIALRHLAGDRVATTLLDPTPSFAIRALSVGEPFGRGEAPAYDVDRICADHGARYHKAAAASVRPDERVVVTDAGETVPYDALLVAVGAHPARAIDDAVTFRGHQDTAEVQELLGEVERGTVSKIAFVVPTGTSWPLPLYELALQTAVQADRFGTEVVLTVITPEPAPLEVFGEQASGELERALADHGIVLRPGTEVRRVEDGIVYSISGAVEARADRVVALPELHGPAIEGLPCNRYGFIPAGDDGAVPGHDGVFAVGDGSTMPIKQGGVAAQHADAAARSIAARAGADVRPRPFRPKLRGHLLGGPDLAGTRDRDQVLWWPPSKVAAPYLASYLERLDAGDPEPVRA
jgi:sulfide:quinone oxidoreductase